MALKGCRKCGAVIIFRRKPGRGGELKWWPCNPDGSNHFETCHPPYTEAMRAEGQRRHPPVKIPCRTRGAYFWTGPVPPWDESLGAYREFTEAEKAEGLVCSR